MIVRGNVKGKDGTILEFADVYVTDKSGRPKGDSVIRAKTDNGGNFNLDIPDSLLKDGEADYLTARPSDPTYKKGIKLLMKNQSNYNFKLGWVTGVLEQEEVEVLKYSNKSKCESVGGVWLSESGGLSKGRCLDKRLYECKKSGGKWDSKKKKCRKPLSNLQKALIVISVLGLVVGGIYAYKQQKKG